ncbi:hypothetical protein [Flavobacterium sp. A45]|nr:hypothetical protein [Flavobacterium sp. A45]
MRKNLLNNLDDILITVNCKLNTFFVLLQTEMNECFLEDNKYK